MDVNIACHVLPDMMACVRTRGMMALPVVIYVRSFVLQRWLTHLISITEKKG